MDAQFLGYSRDSRDKLAAPVFRYRVGKNVIETSTTIAADGKLEVSVSGDLATAQSFALNDLLKGATVSAGKIENSRWNLPAGKNAATLSGSHRGGVEGLEAGCVDRRVRARAGEQSGRHGGVACGLQHRNYFHPRTIMGATSCSKRSVSR